MHAPESRDRRLHRGPRVADDGHRIGQHRSVAREQDDIAERHPAHNHLHHKIVEAVSDQQATDGREHDGDHEPDREHPERRAIGIPTGGVDGGGLAAFLSECLDEQDLRDALLERRHHAAAAFAHRLALNAQRASKEAAADGDHGQKENRGEDDHGLIAELCGEHDQRHHEHQQRHDWRQHAAIKYRADRRAVVHHAENGVADFLIGVKRQGGA